MKDFYGILYIENNLKLIVRVRAMILKVEGPRKVVSWWGRGAGGPRKIFKFSPTG